MAEQGFDISKYITAADIASAITAGVIAYIKNRPKIDDQQPTAEPPAAKPVSNADPTIRVDRGRIDIQDPKLWKDGGVVNMNGNEIHVFKAPDGSTIRVNPYQLQAAGGDPMKAAMNQFAAKVQNGQVDMDKLFAAGGAPSATPAPTASTGSHNFSLRKDFLTIGKNGDASDILDPTDDFYAEQFCSPETLQAFKDSGRMETILKKLLDLGEDVSIPNGTGTYEGNPLLPLLTGSNPRGLKGLWSALSNGASDEEAIRAYIQGASAQCAKTSFAKKAWNAALAKLNGGS